MKSLKLLAVAAMVLFAASVVRADDTHVNMNGGPGSSPTCGSNTGMATDLGVLTADCHVLAVSAGGTGEVTSFSFDVLDADTIGGGLTCSSDLVTVDGWTGVLAAHNPGGVDVCTVTAPTYVSLQTYINNCLLHDCYLGGPTLSTFKNDGDCDLDDFVLGIVVGCDILIDSVSGPSGNFVPDAYVGYASNGNPLPALPEPGTFGLLAIGLTGLPFLRRKFAR